MSHPEIDTVITGGGLAGLACARHLHAAGRGFLICEAADRAGGRFATDVCKGYRLDRGFQVLLTAYPEARRVLSVACLYFTAASSPVSEPILLLNGEGAGPVNNLTVLSAVAPEKPARLHKGLYQCGDHCGIASLNTAQAGGAAAAQAVLEDLP